MSTEPLTFELNGRTLRFATLDDFAFSLSGRARIAADSLRDLMQLTANELRLEAAGIRDMERRFVDLLADALKDPGAVGTLLGEVDGALIAEDNQWRGIIAALVNEKQGFDEYKHLALVKYMQFLAARREVIKTIYAQRFGGQEPLAGQESAVNGSPKSTLILDEDAEPDTDSSRIRFERLPRGETVAVTVPPRGPLSILLSRHKFQLHAGDDPRLTDDNGVNYPLKSGVNVIGRHPGNDVVVGGWYRDVSRKHLLVDIGAGTLGLTDLSTHGTFLPRAALRKEGA